MKIRIFPVIIAISAALFGGCGKSSETAAPALDPATQPEAQAAVFQRMSDRVSSLITAKDFVQAQQTLDALKSYKLTPEQQKLVDKLQAQIPKTN